MQTLPEAPPSWQLPRLGEVAAEPLPSWLIDLMVSGIIVVNSYGGFTMTGTDSRSCSAGDVVMLLDGGEIAFFTEMALAA